MGYYPQFPEIIPHLRVGYPRVTEHYAEGLTLSTRMAKSNSNSGNLWQDQPDFAFCYFAGLYAPCPYHYHMIGKFSCCRLTFPGFTVFLRTSDIREHIRIIRTEILYPHFCRKQWKPPDPYWSQTLSPEAPYYLLTYPKRRFGGSS